MSWNKVEFWKGNEGQKNKTSIVKETLKGPKLSTWIFREANQYRDHKSIASLYATFYLPLMK